MDLTVTTTGPPMRRNSFRTASPQIAPTSTSKPKAGGSRSGAGWAIFPATSGGPIGGCLVIGGAGRCGPDGGTPLSPVGSGFGSPRVACRA